MKKINTFGIGIFFIGSLIPILNNFDYSKIKDSEYNDNNYHCLASEVYEQGETYTQPNYYTWKYDQNIKINSSTTEDWMWGGTFSKTFDFEFPVETIVLKTHKNNYNPTLVHDYYSDILDVYVPEDAKEIRENHILGLISEENIEKIINYDNENWSWDSKKLISEDEVGIKGQDYFIDPISPSTNKYFSDSTISVNKSQEIEFGERRMDHKDYSNFLKLSNNGLSATLNLNLSQGDGEWDYNDQDYGWHSVNLVYDIYSITDHYSFKNDEYNINDSQELLETHLYSDDTDLGAPFLTSDKTYSYLEDEILNNHLITSKNGIPYEVTDIIFYNDEHGTKIIDENESLDSKDIYVSLCPKANFEDETGEMVFIEQSPIMHFEIPYVNLVIESEGIDNVYDWGDLYSNNTKDGNWIYDGNKWNFNTNNPTIINGNYREGVKSIKIGNEKEVSLNSSENYDEINDVVQNSKTWINSNSQIYENETYNSSIPIEVKTYENYVFSFDYNLNVNNLDDIKISHLSDGNENDISLENQKIAFDVNQNANDEVDFEGDEFFIYNEVNNYGFKWTNYSNKSKKYKYNFDSASWLLEESEYNGENITDEGIYLLNDEDIFGNVNYEIVNFTPSSNLEDDLFDNVENSTTYMEDKKISSQQGIEDYSVLTSQEMRKINGKVSSGELRDLSSIVMNPIILKDQISQFQENEMWKNIQPVLEEKLSEQMKIDNNLNSDDYVVNWEINNKSIEENQRINTGDKISYYLTPSGNWNTKGISPIQEFDVQLINDLSTYQKYLQNLDLNEVTREFEQGTEFLNIRKRLEEEINGVLEENYLPSETLNYEWFEIDGDKKISLHDDDKIYYNMKIGFEITSKNEYMQNSIMYLTPINSETYYNLNHLEINEDYIQNETSTFEEGITFGDKREYLEQMIFDQVTEQGYGYLVENGYIGINWTYNEGYQIHDDTILNKWDGVQFEIVSYNENIAKERYISNEFSWGVEISTSKDSAKILWIVLLLISIIGIIILAIAFYQSNKNKKNKNKREKIGEDNLDLELINELQYVDEGGN